MSWFRRQNNRPKKPTESRDLPDGVWTKCENCSEILYFKELERNLHVCPKCGNHFRIRSHKYVEILTDPGTFQETNANVVSKDPLKFKDSKKYTDRVKDAVKKTGMNEAIVTGTARLDELPVVLGVMDFAFIGGSMASAVGEKIARSLKLCLERKEPMILVSASGGARMMEGILSLMQMAKTSVLLARLRNERIPYISILTHPTTGGVTASFASLGDVILAEPGALIGFAGPRVIKETVAQELPEGFQRSEFLMKHGFLDRITPRSELKQTVGNILRVFHDGVNASSHAGIAFRPRTSVPLSEHDPVPLSDHDSFGASEGGNGSMPILELPDPDGSTTT
ncbi:MAG: acetyl-CoA carboxylase carboxyltransferase subunit beta [Candidatus Eisenbacteria bacterium]|uniref:Acetyl-coenzyme A carboxylase carboxyl transferase subunit beta n=1 Tax=Eiseniibacteriota bacterium TaxID=2212470 RepID=A0A7Y2H124_UNCEI|nr:acetyl-CoA carboxylase carboxyltransferase subunit beta [Candidatus Eisenbacteria bacterium]